MGFISIHAARVGCDCQFGLYSFQFFFDFNPRSPSGLRHHSFHLSFWPHIISIHAARVGCDDCKKCAGSCAGNISIHAARVGCDCQFGLYSFQFFFDFNPRSPSGLRHHSFHLSFWPHIISIHAARVGCDDCKKCAGSCAGNISIHAARVGCDINTLCKALAARGISIHAARVGCDYY